MRKIFDEHMEEIINFTVIAIIAIITLAAIIVSNIQENKKWNNGYCECGGSFVYEQAVGHNNYTRYIYKCDHCGKRVEFNRIR